MLLFSISDTMLEALNSWFPVFIKDCKVSATVFIPQIWKMRFVVVKKHAQLVETWVISIRLHWAQIKVIIDESSLKIVRDFSSLITYHIVEGMGNTRKQQLPSCLSLMENITNWSQHLVLLSLTCLWNFQSPINERNSGISNLRLELYIFFILSNIF